MHVLVMGSGVMGEETVNQLVKFSDAEITLSDLEPEKAENVVRSIEEQDISVAKIDVSDPENLRKNIESINPDVVANTVGPFYKYADGVYQACLETGVDCVDICDDIKGAEAALSLNQEAKEMDTSIVTGAGDSPGLTNIIAKYGADQLDEVESIDIFWVAPQSDVGPAQFYHALDMFANSRAYIDGELIEAQGTRTVDFEAPLGTVELNFTDHPEVYTLPKYIEGVTQVRNAGAMYPKLPVSPPEAGQMLRRITEEFGDSGRTDAVKDSLVELLSNTRVQMLDKLDSEDTGYDLGGTRVEVKGRLDGSGVEYIFSSLGRGMDSTPRTLATVTKMVAKGDVPSGAYAPEGCIDPNSFIHEFSDGQLSLECKPQSYEIRLEKGSEGRAR